MKAIFRAFSGMSALLFLALAGTALAQQPTLAEQAELMKESDPVLAPAPVPVQAPAPAPAPARAPLAGKATIGVMAWSDFVPDRAEPMKGQRIGLPAELADRIIEGLSASGRFTVVERAALRRVVVEQRFGSRLQESYLDRTLDKAIGVMEQVQDGGGVLVSPSASEGESRVLAGEGAIGTTGALADFNDLIKDYKDLGMATGAQFLVLGELKRSRIPAIAARCHTAARAMRYRTTAPMRGCGCGSSMPGPAPWLVRPISAPHCQSGCFPVPTARCPIATAMLSASMTRSASRQPPRCWT